MKIRIIAPFIRTTNARGFKSTLFDPRFYKDPFYIYLFSALETQGAKWAWWKSRPTPEKKGPKMLRSVFITFDNQLVVFDKSDHIQEFDLEALKICDVYFKDQLNLIEKDRVLNKVGLEEHGYKIVPFVSVGDVDFFKKIANKVNQIEVENDFCHITGVYYHPKQLFSEARMAERNGHDHTWIRYNLHLLLKNEKSVKGISKLTCKHKVDVDNEIVTKTYSLTKYAKSILSARVGISNSIAHRVWPWKVTEIVALGKPFALDEAPITEFPEPFRLKQDVHYIEIFPGLTSLDTDMNADPDNLNSYRCLIKEEFYNPESLEPHFDAFVKKLKDKDYINYLSENINKFRTEVLFNKEVIAEYILDKIREVKSKKGEQQVTLDT